MPRTARKQRVASLSSRDHGLPGEPAPPAAAGLAAARWVITPGGSGQEDGSEHPWRDNSVRTSKYTWVTFLPKNLWEQFHRFANVYFLFIAVLNWLPIIQAFARETAIFPLLLVLFVTAVKDYIEDQRRHRSDREVNNSTATALARDGTPSQLCWKDLRVGDFVELCCDDVIPADMVLLHTSNEDNVCFIETSNLDGETNLKQRHTAFPATPTFHPDAFTAPITVEAPNNKIYSFQGHMVYDGATYPLDSSNLLLRGCTLRITAKVYGVVVYAGHDTKAMLNDTGPRSKRSSLERQMNVHVIYCLVVLFLMCLTCGMGSGIWTSRRPYRNTLYLPFEEGDPGPPFEGFVRFWTFFIIFQVMVPISLYVSLEIIKLGQVHFISNDLELYHEPTDRRIICRALNVTEDLGQIEYIFSDKTGTLTENQMLFKHCTIAGTNYNSTAEEAGSDQTADPAFQFLRDPALVAGMEALFPDDHGSPLHLFFTGMAVCNTVVPAPASPDVPLPSQESGSCAPPALGEISFQAEHPDEEAFVAAAQAYGFALVLSNARRLVVNIKGHQAKHDVLVTLPFDSSRKMMSVIVRCPDGQIRLFVKGADSMVLARLAASSSPELREATARHLDDYARSGLRTLCFAVRSLSDAEYEAWKKAYDAANLAIEDRRAAVRSRVDEMERDLTLLGATGIEDRLQDGVPDAIAALRSAGIKVWMLTGDKQETAVEIARTCRLLSPRTHLLFLNVAGDSDDAVRRELNALAAQCAAPAVRDQASVDDLGLVVDGHTLSLALLGDHRQAFLEVAQQCKAVVVCRATPLQKAQVVELVKESLQVMTLAIGDGANDVSMIQMADVGVGISGQEGMQAVNSSDFAIARFRFLERLLLVHGHWCYYRLALVIRYFFYKNALYVFALFWFQFFCGFSGQNAIDQISLILFTLLWNSVPPIVVGIFDQDVSARTLMLNPRLYLMGRENRYYRGTFWPAMLNALWQSLVIFFVPYFAYRQGVQQPLLVFGTAVNSAGVIVTNVEIGLATKLWNKPIVLSLLFSIVGYFATLPILTGIPATNLIPDPYWISQFAYSTGVFWFSVIAAAVVAVAPRWMILFWYDWFRPSLAAVAHEVDVVRERGGPPTCCGLSGPIPYQYPDHVSTAARARAARPRPPDEDGDVEMLSRV